MNNINRIIVAGLLLMGFVVGCSTLPPYVGDWTGEGTFDGASNSVVLAINNGGKFRGFLVGPTNQWHVGRFEVASSNAVRIVLKANVLTDLNSTYPAEDEDVADASIEWVKGTKGDSTLVYQFKRKSGRTEFFRLTK